VSFRHFSIIMLKCSDTSALVQTFRTLWHKTLALKLLGAEMFEESSRCDKFTMWWVWLEFQGATVRLTHELIVLFAHHIKPTLPKQQPLHVCCGWAKTSYPLHWLHPFVTLFTNSAASVRRNTASDPPPTGLGLCSFGSSWVWCGISTYPSALYQAAYKLTIIILAKSRTHFYRKFMFISAVKNQSV